MRKRERPSRNPVLTWGEQGPEALTHLKLEEQGGIGRALVGGPSPFRLHSATQRESD